MRVQSQNNKNQESTIFFKKAKLQSAISKCHLSATEFIIFFIQGIVGRDVFLNLRRKMCRPSAVLMSLGS